IMFTARHRPLAVRLIAAVTTGVSSLGALWIYVVYDREAAGFQFYEKFPLVPPLGISYELGVDGISLLLVLLTSVIIVAGVFASWTITVRSQEFYALLLALVTGVFGVLLVALLQLLELLHEGLAQLLDLMLEGLCLLVLLHELEHVDGGHAGAARGPSLAQDQHHVAQVRQQPQGRQARRDSNQPLHCLFS